MGSTEKSPITDRPLSPHLQIWGWTVTMAASIAHRITGVALYGGSILLAAWLAAAAYSEEAYGMVAGVMHSLPGRIILIGFTYALLFHLINGIRHLFWDAGQGFELKTARASAWLTFFGAALLTALIWTYGLTQTGV